MRNSKLLKLAMIFSIFGCFMLCNSAQAQNSGYLMANMGDAELDAQSLALLEEAIGMDAPRNITGVNYDYVGEGIYTLGVNDVINISVMRHPEVSGDYIINKDGKIQYGFVGDIFVAGLDKDGVKELISKELEEYIVEPDVTVTITGYFSKVVFVIGEVGRPGRIYMKGDTITVREALIDASLPLLSAKGSKSTLITPSDDGTPNIQKINVDRLLYKGDLRENYVMRPGDMLYVPPTIMARTMRAISPVTAPVRESVGTASSVYGF